MKKLILLIGLICASTYFSIAQQPNINQQNVTGQQKLNISRIGLQVGANITQVVFTQISDMALYPDLQIYPRFNAGFYSESGSTQNFVTRIGLFYSGAGYKTKEINTTLEYLKIPLIFNFRSKISGPVHFMVGAGPYGSFAFHGVMKYDNLIDRDILSMPGKNLEQNKPYKYYDLGVTFSGSIELLLNNNNTIKLGASYDFGIIDVSNEYKIYLDETNKIVIDEGAKNRVLSINFSYLIDLNTDN